ncbi:MAG: hypothetical protein PUG50_06435 [Eubacteriales bacterium]|jgi:hypothetical protein|uniref:hypothetical protein n=1 Tax=Fenollaria TaxID=1686313 RepID=UPI00071DC221|nr:MULTISPECIES: hypothetical protein [Fenollaria]MDD7340203.1 hypothetical protein [Eubacteriales bacterium]MDY3105514.1 hypothetical protein [Fenollaria sp.]
MAKTIDDKFMDLMKETNEKFDALRNKIDNIPKMSKAGTRLITKEEKELIENSMREEKISKEENTEENTIEE